MDRVSRRGRHARTGGGSGRAPPWAATIDTTASAPEYGGVAGLPGMIEKPLAEFAAYVRRRFGERLEQLVLFGSWARGDADPLESDIDVLVVVRGLTVDELMELVGESARISVQYNLQINPLGMTADYYEELRQDDRLLYREVAREGVPL